MHDVQESDWREFRKIQDAALQRLCDRILSEASAVIRDDSKTPHERYLRLYRMIRTRDRDVAAGFNDSRRSRMRELLHVLADLELLEPGEMERFSPEIQRSFRDQ